MEPTLDAISYSLLFATWLTSKVARGEVSVDVIGSMGDFHGKILAFLFILFSGLLFIYLIRYIVKLLAKTSFRRGAPLIVLECLVATLLFTVYTYVFFSTSGGWATGGRPGISGGLGNFLLDLGVYFLFALVASALLMAKEKFHQRFNTSVALFVIAIVISLVSLYSIFFVAP